MVSEEPSVLPSAEDWTAAAESGQALREHAGESGSRPATPHWSPASARISAQLVQELIDEARRGYPNEACGILAGDRVAEDGGAPTRFVALRNAAESPYRYLIDADEQLAVMLEIDDADETIWGIFHSHVASTPEPSVTDVGLAFYPDALHVICSLASEMPSVRAWSILDGVVHEVVLEVA